MTAPGVGEKLAGSAFVLTGVAFAIGVVVIGRRGLRTTARGADLATSDGGTPVLRIRQPLLLHAAAVLMIFCFGAGSLLYGAAPLAAGGGPGVVLLIIGVLVVGFTPVLVAWGRSEIRLDPRTVLVRTGGKRLAAAWEDVEAVYGYETRYVRPLVVAARRVDREAGRLAWSTRAQRRRDEHLIEITPDQFGVAPVLLYHLLRFYHANPQARGELGTAAAVQRLRAARFR
jgi:hypothetical protein